MLRDVVLWAPDRHRLDIKLGSNRFDRIARLHYVHLEVVVGVIERLLSRLSPLSVAPADRARSVEKT
jgi:hypothetical protein